MAIDTPEISWEFLLDNSLRPAQARIYETGWGTVSMSSFLKFGSTRSNSRKFEGVAFVVAFLLGSVSGFRFIGGYLYLIYTYGFQRVFNEHLHLMKMGKTDPWIVSNGDQIAGGGFPWFIVASGISIAISLSIFLLIYRLLPDIKNKNAA